MQHVRDRREEGLGDALRPEVDVALAREQILPDLELHVRNPALLAVHDDRVVGVVADGVRLVVTDDQCLISAQCLENQPREPHIASVENSGVPRSSLPQVDRRESVQCDQNAR